MIKLNQSCSVNKWNLSFLFNVQLRRKVINQHKKLADKAVNLYRLRWAGHLCPNNDYIDGEC